MWLFHASIQNLGRGHIGWQSGLRSGSPQRVSLIRQRYFSLYDSLMAILLDGESMGYFIVKKEFTNEDKDKKTTYHPGGAQISDANFPKRRLEKWEKLGWIEWHK